MLGLTVFANFADFETNSWPFMELPPEVTRLMVRRTVQIQSAEFTMPEGRGNLFLVRRLALPSGGVLTWAGLYQFWEGVDHYPARPGDTCGLGVWLPGDAEDRPGYGRFLMETALRLRQLLPSVAYAERRLGSLTLQQLGIGDEQARMLIGDRPFGPERLIATCGGTPTGTVFMASEPGRADCDFDTVLCGAEAGGYQSTYISEAPDIVGEVRSKRSWPVCASGHVPPPARPVVNEIARFRAEFDEMTADMRRQFSEMKAHAAHAAHALHAAHAALPPPPPPPPRDAGSAPPAPLPIKKLALGILVAGLLGGGVIHVLVAPWLDARLPRKDGFPEQDTASVVGGASPGKPSDASLPAESVKAQPPRNTVDVQKALQTFSLGLVNRQKSIDGFLKSPGLFTNPRELKRLRDELVSMRDEMNRSIADVEGVPDFPKAGN